MYLHTREVATEGAGRGDAEGPRPLPRKGAKKLPRHPFREHSFSPPPSLQLLVGFSTRHALRARTPNFLFALRRGLATKRPVFLDFALSPRAKGTSHPPFSSSNFRCVFIFSLKFY